MLRFGLAVVSIAFDSTETVSDAEESEEEASLVPSISGSFAFDVLQVVRAITNIITKKGTVSWSAETLSKETPANITPVTKNGATVVPMELMAQVKFMR